MVDPSPEQIEAAALPIFEMHAGFAFSDDFLGSREWSYALETAEAALVAAAGAAPHRDDLVERIADALAYYQCRETNPKADDPRMGYHSFSEEQRAHLRQQKAEAAAEIVRMFAAAGAAPQDNGKCGGCRDLGPHRNVPNCDFYEPPTQVDEAKLAEVIWAEQESRVLNGYVIHTRATAAATAAAVASHLRGGQQ